MIRCHGAVRCTVGLFIRILLRILLGFFIVFSVRSTVPIRRFIRIGLAVSIGLLIRCWRWCRIRCWCRLLVLQDIFHHVDALLLAFADDDPELEGRAVLRDLPAFFRQLKYLSVIENIVAGILLFKIHILKLCRLQLAARLYAFLRIQLHLRRVQVLGLRNRMLDREGNALKVLRYLHILHRMSGEIDRAVRDDQGAVLGI